MTTLKIRITSKPKTITRADITADTKFTKGKQLVEHNPFSLIPDPENPRPGEIINDLWLIQNLGIGTDQSLCFFDKNTDEYHIPKFNELANHLDASLESDYNFLRDLAFSIRKDGMIEPIEIFLADRSIDPEYFLHTDLEYGYVVLEGHQRRLAAMMAGVPTITCIELTDLTTLARLKVKHRKLQRQLSENNLRKDLTVSQNFQILRELLASTDVMNLPLKKLSSIIGLNEDIVGALKRVVVNQHDFPTPFINVILDNQVTFSWIRKWVNKSAEDILAEINRLQSGKKSSFSVPKVKQPKKRGTQGGALKRSATFKIKSESDSILLRNLLITRFPEIKLDSHESSPFIALEKILVNILECAKSVESDLDRI